MRRYASTCKLGVRHLFKIEIAKTLVDNVLDESVPLGTVRVKGKAADKLRQIEAEEAARPRTGLWHSSLGR